MSRSDEAGALSREQYAALATFRLELRRFLVFSEAAAAAEGLPAQQHQALLAIAGRSEDEPATVGRLSDQLLVAPHTAAELVGRMVEGGLLTKTSGATDRRRMELAMTPYARTVLERLTAVHLEELQSLEPSLVKALRRTLRHAAADASGSR